jgi:hypothetical protein
MQRLRLFAIGWILSFCMRVALANDRQLKNFTVTDQHLDSVLLAEFIWDFRRPRGFQTNQNRSPENFKWCWMQYGCTCQHRVFPQRLVINIESEIVLQKPRVNGICKVLNFHRTWLHFVQKLHTDDLDHQYTFYEWFKLKIILTDDVMFSDDACPHVNVHVNPHIVHWAQDKPHAATDAHHQTNPSITVWCTIHGNTCLGLLFLRGIGGWMRRRSVGRTMFPFAE